MVARQATQDARERHGRATEGQDGACVRPFPYPYRAAIAICSDVDDTASTDEFLAIQEFLNTTRLTAMGPGVGLEIGNSFYFQDRSRGFQYFSDDPRARSVIEALVESGHLDCLHTYGDGATARDDAQRGLEVLYRLRRRIRVWVNHYGAASNIAGKFAHTFGGCHGDDPSSPAYHTDLTLAYGVRYAWVGSLARVAGQDTARPGGALRTVVDGRYPLRSADNLLREMRRRSLGRKHGSRYALLRENALTGVLSLRDGNRVHEFVRYWYPMMDVGPVATSRGLARALAPHVLRWLEDREGWMIVYTHLGKNADCPQPIAPETQAALRELAATQSEGRILVTTTSRLLALHAATRHLRWALERSEYGDRICIEGLDDAILGLRQLDVEELQGLTFYVPNPHATQVFLDGRPIAGVRSNPPDSTGRVSISLPVSRLEYPL